MPPTTRKTSAQRTSSGGGGRQATLSFHHRVTKPTGSKSAAKEEALSAGIKKRDSTDKLVKAKGTRNDDKEDEDDGEEAATARLSTDKAGIVKGSSQDDEEAEVEQEHEVEDDQGSETSEPVLAPVAAPFVKSDAEIQAETVTKAQIRRYWQGIEAQRMAKRVHQEGLEIGEKVLRYFDISSQYGPCIGISRKKRWMRAQRLGLEPPIEVLAVLLDEEAKGHETAEKAFIDGILNPVIAV